MKLSALHSKGKILDLSSPVIMGILNATPNSFFNKGRESDVDGLLQNAEKMINDGASILDIGGASTKPGEELIGVEEELRRVIPAVSAIHERFPETWLSVDTYNAAVAKAAVKAGALIVNDVSSGAFDKEMITTVAALEVPYIIMHMQGTPKTMQIDPKYSEVVKEVYEYLEAKINECTQAGIKEIIVDPGFGFGKTVEHNFALLRELQTFQRLGKPVLAGLSRKSMVCKPLKVNPEHALTGTIALNMAALERGANILRVHDVKEARQTLIMAQLLGNGSIAQ